MDQMANFPGVSEIANYGITFITSQFGYISSYEENLEKLTTEVQRLEDTKAGMLHRVVEAERKGDKIENIVWNWLKKANETVAEANKVIDVEGARWCLGQYCPYLWTRCQLSKSFEKMTKEISDVIKNGKIDIIFYRDEPEVTITPFCRGYEALESRTSMLNEIKEILKDPKIYMIGVHGMGGVGKTTLVNELAWQVKNDDSFGTVAIATITQYPNVENIQDQIAEAIWDKKLEKTTKVGREGELHQRIKAQKKSVLIILDDIWRELDLIEVGIPFGTEHNGCKLVMTSRDLNVLKKMGTQKEFDLRALLEEDSWILFQKMAGDVVKEFNIKPIAERVAKCCAGLPLLIDAVAKGLRKKDVCAWRVALNQLKGFKHKELEKNVYPALKLSYDFLDTEELKTLFLFIGSFGLNEIRIEDLFLSCWGLGFYKDMHTLMEARDTHYTLINDLRASSLLLEGKPEWIRMHDVVRDVAKSIASTSPSTYADQLRKCHCIHFRSSLTEVPTDNFFSGMKEVMTLSLYGVSFTPFPHASLNLLINLRSLNLYQCKLGDIRMVAKLTNLEILNLEESCIKELPQEIGYLTHLRLLNLTNCFQLQVIPTNLMSRLTCLEELYMGGCDIEWEVEGSKSERNNASLGELRNLHQLTTLEILISDTSVLPRDLRFLAELERYNILIGDIWNRHLSSQWYGGGRGTSRTLKLTHSWWTSISLSTVEDLSFAKLKGVKDLLYELDVEGFPQLKHLHIQNSDELLHIINSRGLVNPHYAFPNLETLVLYNLYKMEEICHGPIPIQSFAKLKVIKVTSCHGLKNLLLYSLARNLSQLHEMEISDCRGITDIIAMEKQEDEKELLEIVLPELHYLTLGRLSMLQSFYWPLTVVKGNPSIQSIPMALFNQQVVMPKLETLTLNEINACKIWDDKLPVLSSFQNLTRLKVIHCDSLTSLFSSWVATTLVKLQHLEISNCSMLNEIFVQEKEVQFPNLETLDISHMSGLRSIWPKEVAPNSFSKLRKINIDHCGSLGYVFPISVAKELQQLQYLTIEVCAIKNIVDKSDSISDMTLVYLEKLTIRECHNIKTIFQSYVLFQSLDELDVDSCGGLVNIISPSTITSSPKLRILTISQCDKLEEIYGSSNEGDAPLALGEIAFMKLEKLTLKYLPKLTSFCQGSYDFKFPSLPMICLINCFMMKTFCLGNLTTPSLTKVQLWWIEDPDFGSSYWQDIHGDAGCYREEHWYGDLNTTIRTIFTKKTTECGSY